VASAEAGVCNVALLRIGHLQTINSLGDNTPAAKACSTLWDFTRDSLLQARTWAFCTRRATLAAIDDGERDGWSYAYTLPADFLAARYVWSGQRNPGKDAVVPFQIEGDASKGRVLLCDESTLSLIYTAQVKEVGRWDPMFRNAMAMSLAADLALGLAKKPVLASELYKSFLQWLNAAAASSANQNQPDTSPPSEFENARS
jgi:hypothetical protein